MSLPLLWFPLIKKIISTQFNQGARLIITIDKRFNVVVYWRRKYKNKQLPNPWYLLTNIENKEEVIKIFASRGGIEALQ